MGTHSKRNEEKTSLAARLHMADQAIRSSINAIAFADLGGMLTFANDSFLEMWGYEQESEVLGRPAPDFWEESDAAAEVIDALKTRDAWMGQLVARRKDGSNFTTQLSGHMVRDSSGKPVCLMASFVDISEQKRAEASLSDSEKKFATFFHNNPAGTVITSLEDGSVLDVNEAFCAITGYDIGDARGRTSVDLGFWPTPGDREAVVNTLREDGSFRNWEFAYRHKSGEIRTGDFSAAVVPLVNQPCIITAMYDTTERKRFEDHLRQMQKMEAIGTLTGGIAHDFNNILGIIIGSAELAREQLRDWHPAHINLEEILRASRRSTAVVRQLLTFARRSEIRTRALHAGPVVEEILTLIRASLTAEIVINQELEATEDTILADPTYLHQVILNLLTNAAQAMKEQGGVMTVGMFNTTLDARDAAAQPELEAGDYLEITVRDNGCGIARKDVGRIFDPFFTTKGPGKGSGMGLAIVQGIVRECGGTVSVESQPGQGSTFTVLFPLTTETVEQPSAPQRALPEGNETILLVDDEPSISRVMQKTLEQLGYSVTTWNNPEEALERFHDDPDRYDLVITDMSMPGMNGDRLASQILEMRPGMPVLICTGFSEKLDEARAIELGIRGFAMKPVSRRDLALKVREVLED